MLDHFKSLRPHQWIKNLFVLVPAFFAGKIALFAAEPKLALTFVSFCLMASATYLLNDIVDREKDQHHEVKRNRPIASGKVKPLTASAMIFILFSAAVGLAFLADVRILNVIAGYFLLNVLYSTVLKHIALIDISVIAFGFILRILAGGLAAEVPISKWLILMTFLLACCLALGKRRDDLLLDIDDNAHRPALRGYTISFIDTALVVLAGTTIVCYIMYTVSEDVVQRLHSDRIYLTSVFVIIGVLRFLQIAIVEQKSGSPTLILLKDTMMQVMIGLWLLSFLFILYAS